MEGDFSNILIRNAVSVRCTVRLLNVIYLKPIS